jgi:hypothetical protein
MGMLEKVKRNPNGVDIHMSKYFLIAEVFLINVMLENVRKYHYSNPVFKILSIIFRLVTAPPPPPHTHTHTHTREVSY